MAVLSVGKAGWFYKSLLYIGSIPLIVGSIPSIRILTLLLGIFLEPIAQLVERWIEAPCVGSSILSRTIGKKIVIIHSHFGLTN